MRNLNKELERFSSAEEKIAFCEGKISMIMEAITKLDTLEIKSSDIWTGAEQKAAIISSYRFYVDMIQRKIDDIKGGIVI